MVWRLSSWLVLVRLFQLLGSFITGAMNGYLLWYIYTNRLGLDKTMIILEILVCLTHSPLSVPRCCGLEPSGASDTSDIELRCCKITHKC